MFVDASLANFSLDKTFKRKSIKVDFLLRGIHSDPQHSAVGCKVCQNAVFNHTIEMVECLAFRCSHVQFMCIFSLSHRG